MDFDTSGVFICEASSGFPTFDVKSLSATLTIVASQNSAKTSILAYLPNMIDFLNAVSATCKVQSHVAVEVST